MPLLSSHPFSGELPSPRMGGGCRSLFLALLVLYVPAVLPFPAMARYRPCGFPAVFNFGDSNSDTGGLSATFGPVPPPYGGGFFGAPAGRYSDGRLIVDFIAKSLDLPYLSSYVDSIGASFSHGANFASAGSTIRMPNTSFFQSNQSPFYLRVQISEFAQFKSRSLAFRNRGGVWKDLLPKESHFSEALYTFDIGQNDLARALFQNYTKDQITSLLEDLIDEFHTAVKTVYELGGRAFWIHGTSPLGCLPYVLVRAPPRSSADTDQFGCGIPHNELAKRFNAMLREKVTGFRKEMPLAMFTFVDIFSVKYKLVTQAAEYGFEMPFTSCCGYGGGKYNFNNNVRCGAKAVVNGTEVVVDEPCKDVGRRVSWDGIHFTEAANKWVFDKISSGMYSEPPLPMNMACHEEKWMFEHERR